MDAYDLHEARFIQDRQIIAVANALSVDSGDVPAGKVWTILGAALFCTAAETKTTQISVWKAGGTYIYPICEAASRALSLVFGLSALTEGMEMKLYPGERIRADRDSATAGSSMVLNLRYIETDLPYYSYVEPQNKVVKASQQHGSVYRRSGGISPAGRGAGAGGGPGGGGGDTGGGRAEPI